MLVYATGAGITAAAGTRLALRSILMAGFGFGTHGGTPHRTAGDYCHSSSLSHRRPGIEQFARLLPALAVVAIFQAPSPESNPNSPSPVSAVVGHAPTMQLIGQKPARPSTCHVPVARATLPSPQSFPAAAPGAPDSSVPTFHCRTLRARQSLGFGALAASLLLRGGDVPFDVVLAIQLGRMSRWRRKSRPHSQARTGCHWCNEPFTDASHSRTRTLPPETPRGTALTLAWLSP